jgi:zinc protease
MSITLDRHTPPPSKPITDISIEEVEKSRLDNGIPVYSLNAGFQDLVKVELLFPTTYFNAKEPLLTSATNRQLSEGTANHTAQQLAELIDYYGAFYEASQTADFCTVEMNVLNKHLQNVLPLLFEIITEPTFPESELNIFKINGKQRLAVENEKVQSIARRKFSELLFGNDHPYGNNIQAGDFDLLHRDHLIGYHHKQYTSEHCTMLVAGMVHDDTLNSLNGFLGKANWSRSNGAAAPFAKINSAQQRKHFVEKDNAVQNAIRIGKVMFNKTHADYLGMLVLNTILGGYFGSRLMKNIREDKGYTYGIGSAIISMQHAGMFFIASEVGSDVSEAALTEIYKELALLRNEPIGEEELATVKSYMLGQFLKSIDGAFNLADRWKGLLFYNLGYDYYYRYIETIKSITAEQLQLLAQKYFDEESFTELVVGKK